MLIRSPVRKQEICCGPKYGYFMSPTCLKWTNWSRSWDEFLWQSHKLRSLLIETRLASQSTWMNLPLTSRALWDILVKTSKILDESQDFLIQYSERGNYPSTKFRLTTPAPPKSCH